MRPVLQETRGRSEPEPVWDPAMQDTEVPQISLLQMQFSYTTLGGCHTLQALLGAVSKPVWGAGETGGPVTLESVAWTSPQSLGIIRAWSDGFTVKTLLPLCLHKCWRQFYSARGPGGISIPESVTPSTRGKSLCRRETFLVSLQSKPCVCSTDLQHEDLVLFQYSYVMPKGTFADRKQLMETQKQNKRRNSGVCAPVKRCA